MSLMSLINPISLISLMIHTEVPPLVVAHLALRRSHMHLPRALEIGSPSHASAESF